MFAMSHHHGGFGRFGRDFFGPGPGSAFGPGPDFGHGRGGPGGPGGRGRPGRRNRGDVRMAILALLAEEPMHGYQIMQEIGERSDGLWTPSPGSIYPTVSQLANEGLVHTTKENGRSVVSLTEQGRSYTEQHRAALDAVWASAGAAPSDESVDLRKAGRALLGAAAQVAHVGDAEQVGEATRLLEDTRRRLYLLLADEDNPGDTDK